MPRSLFQEIVFTVMMVFVMVYGMICYNIALAVGGLNNQVFINAFHELVIMGPVAFILDMLIAGPLAKRFTFRTFNPKETKPVWIVLSISVCSIWFMCPLMSFAATVIFKGGLFQKEVISIWLQTTVLNYPMAAMLQLVLAGPVVRRIFGLIFSARNSRQPQTAEIK